MQSLALALAQVGRTGDAEAQLRRLIEIAPGQSMGYYFLADVYEYFLNRHPEATSLRRKAFDLDPEGVTRPHDLARMYLNLGDDTSAETWVQIAERINSDSNFAINARYFLARYRDDKKQAELSSQQMAKLVQVVRGGWTYISDFAWLRDLHKQDPELALGIYKELDLRLIGETPVVTPASPAIAIGLADLYLQTENERLAHDLLDQSMAVLEATTDHYQNIAKTAIYALKGDTSNALKELRISIDANWRWEWWMLEKDPIFQAVWDEPEFQIMMDEIRADMAVQLEQVREMRRNGELEAIPEAALTE
jgi:predicted Zn-dependent protease